MTWVEISQSESFRGRWVALDKCRYERNASHPAEGDVVDADEDLAVLCNRVREANRAHCAIIFCDEEAPPPSRAPLDRRSVPTLSRF